MIASIFRYTAFLLLLSTGSSLWAASCCGGGSASSLILPKFVHHMLEISANIEQYDGYWDQSGKWKPDPSGSDLNQYRLNLGYAQRLAANWQASVSVPYVFNDNNYSSTSTSTNGVGDSSVSLWYEAFKGPMCVTKVNKVTDLLPATYFGMTLTIPSGISPYDDIEDNFDITGRGMYRLDGHISIEKSIAAWTTVLKYSYGKYFSRDVNKEYGRFVDPYSKQFGDRQLASFSVGYSHLIPSMDSLTYTLSYAYLREDAGETDGEMDQSSAIKKRSSSLGVAYSTLNRQWIYKLSWNHALKSDGNGENFPTTEVYTLGLAHVF
ncbi:MAG: hypothetical protein JKY01_02340 [Pseudomonadales bacterium]|nr:hypothetical protein [Pseudomonadales bacterium]